MTSYFSDCRTIQQARTEYHRLAKIHHPDLGGDVETMKQINLQYHSFLENRHGETERGSDNEDHTYYYNATSEDAVIEALMRILKTDLPGCEIRLIGKWIWVTGDTKANRDKLGKEGLKLQWHSKRIAWYWKGTQYRTRYNDRVTLDDLQEVYGGKNFRGSASKPKSDRERADYRIGLA